MLNFLDYFRGFLRSVHTGLLIFCILYAAILISINYRFGIEPRILAGISSRWLRFAGFYLVYLLAFAVPYLFAAMFCNKQLFDHKALWLLVVIAPAIFALKVNFNDIARLVQHKVAGDHGRYLGIIVNLPSRFIPVFICMLIVWWVGKYPAPFFGATVKNVSWTPYLIMLMIMVPLVAWASTQPDFLRTYPKLKSVAFMTDQGNIFHKLLFELSYGLDFVTIELFFRGFLVLAFIRYAGQEAILPMAVFYCSIHFGKPMMECISSLFGGMILGVVVYRTGSIAGGLLVHLGIAWLMEIGGYIGSSRLATAN